MSSEDSVDAVAAANERFYQAFEALDLDKMSAVWARRLDDVCIHPGWEILEGWPAIRESWAAIFANTSYMRFEPSDVEVEVFGEPELGGSRAARVPERPRRWPNYLYGYKTWGSMCLSFRRSRR